MPTFPEIGPAYKFTRTPAFVVDVVPYRNAREQRLLRTSSPRYLYRAHWPLLTEAEKQLIQAFFIARKGRCEGFNFIDPDRDSTTYGQALPVRFAADIVNLQGFNYQLWRLNTVDLVGA